MVKLSSMKKIIQQAITAHEQGNLEKAEQLYRSILKSDPKNLDVNGRLSVLLYALGRFAESETYFRKVIEINPDFAEGHSNLGVLLHNLDRATESEISCRKSIELRSDSPIAHYNLGNTLKTLKKLDEAEASYKKAIELNPDYVEALNNLGTILQIVGRFEEAEVIFKKVIELNPDHIESHNNLGVVLENIGRLEEAETRYKKVLKLKPNQLEAHYNLDTLLKRKKLLIDISHAQKKTKKTEVKFSNVSSNSRLSPNPFTSKRKVEPEFFTGLYKISTEEFNKTKDARYGNGRCSDFKLLESKLPIIKKITDDLSKIMKQAVGSDIFIIDSFLNIYKAGSGTLPHNHISYFDKAKGLVSQKYSLTYYLSVGDQNSSEPGNLKIYDPDEEILLSDGEIVILPSSRRHSAVYGGKKDRIMIGINFYSLL